MKSTEPDSFCSLVQNSLHIVLHLVKESAIRVSIHLWLLVLVDNTRFRTSCLVIAVSENVPRTKVGHACYQTAACGLVWVGDQLFDIPHESTCPETQLHARCLKSCVCDFLQLQEGKLMVVLRWSEAAAM